MFPEFDSFYVTHNRKDKVKIAYHGNIVHLNSFYKGITPALNELGKKYEIELHAVYNIKQFGKWSLGRPNKKRCKVYDLQWYENCYKDYFQDIDIGIVPNLTPIETGLFSKVVDRVIHIPSRYFFPVTHMDHHLDYKFSSNPGRIYVFSKFKIPVVTEASPSVSNLLSDNKSGKIVLSPHGWYHALEDLIQNPKKRKSLSDNLLKEIENFYSPEITFKEFFHFLKKIHKKKPPILKISSPYFTKELIAHIAWRIYKKASTIFYLNS
jgi:hypothetical protein